MIILLNLWNIVECLFVVWGDKSKPVMRDWIHFGEVVYFKSEYYVNRHFPKEDILIDNKHMKICSTSFAIWKVLIKTTVKYHFPLTGYLYLKRQ